MGHPVEPLTDYQVIYNELQVAVGSPFGPRAPPPPPDGRLNQAFDNLDPREKEMFATAFADYFNEFLPQIMNGQNGGLGGYGTLDLPKLKPRKTRGGQRFLGNILKIPLDILCRLTGICLNKPPGGGGIGGGGGGGPFQPIPL